MQRKYMYKEGVKIFLVNLKLKKSYIYYLIKCD